MLFPFLTLSQIEMETMTGHKLWFRGRFLGLGAVERNGTKWEGPIFGVDDNLYMLIVGAGTSPNVFWCEFIQLDEPAKPVTIDTAELKLRPVLEEVQREFGFEPSDSAIFAKVQEMGNRRADREFIEDTFAQDSRED